MVVRFLYALSLSVVPAADVSFFLTVVVAVGVVVVAVAVPVLHALCVIRQLSVSTARLPVAYSCPVPP